MVQPALAGTYYEKPAKYMLIETKAWDTKDNNLIFPFSLESLTQRYGNRVYITNEWCSNADFEAFSVTRIAIIEKLPELYFCEQQIELFGSKLSKISH